jgi:hypothetical protein
LLCREKGVPFRALVAARFGHLFYWATDEVSKSTALEAAIANQPEPSDDDVREVQATLAPHSLSSPEAIRSLYSGLRWSAIIRSSVIRIAQRLYGLLRGYRYALYGYHLWSTIAQLVRSRMDWKQLRRDGIKDLNVLNGRKIVFFPLQVEPESSLQTLAPYFTDQLAIARELALSLPADAVLAVKEHIWQLGRRTRGFYETLRGMPNVVLLAPDIRGTDVIRRSDLICAISGSAAHEAAVLGKPVIYFQAGSPLLALKHVHLFNSTRDFEHVSELLEDCELDSKLKRQRDGARYWFALRRFCFEIVGPSITMRQDRPTEEELVRIGNALFASLREDVTHDVQPALAV